MMLTRKHFRAIAEILKNNSASEKLINDFSHYLRSENSNFNFNRFKTASTSENETHNPVINKENNPTNDNIPSQICKLTPILVNMYFKHKGNKIIIDEESIKQEFEIKLSEKVKFTATF